MLGHGGREGRRGPVAVAGLSMGRGGGVGDGMGGRGRGDHRDWGLWMRVAGSRGYDGSGVDDWAGCDQVPAVAAADDRRDGVRAVGVGGRGRRGAVGVAGVHHVGVLHGAEAVRDVVAASVSTAVSTAVSAAVSASVSTAVSAFVSASVSTAEATAEATASSMSESTSSVTLAAAVYKSTTAVTFASNESTAETFASYESTAAASAVSESTTTTTVTESATTTVSETAAAASVRWRRRAVRGSGRRRWRMVDGLRLRKSHVHRSRRSRGLLLSLPQLRESGEPLADGSLGPRRLRRLGCREGQRHQHL